MSFFRTTTCLASLNIIGWFVFQPTGIQEKEFTRTEINHILGMFFTPDILVELETTEEQRTKIKQAIDANQKSGILIRSNENLTGKEQMEKMFQLEEDCFDTVFRGILLPHQRERLLQLKARFDLQKHSGSFARFVSKELDMLHLTNFQKDELKQVAENNRQLLRREVEVFRQHIESILGNEKEEVLKLLNKEQRATVLEILGDKYEGDGHHNDVVHALLLSILTEFENLRKNR